MRVLLVDTNAVRPAEQAKALALAARGNEVTLLTPRSFKENYRLWHTHRPEAAPFSMVLANMVGKPPNRCVFTGGLRAALAPRPDAILVLSDENFWLTSQILLARDLLCPRAAFICHSWQNLDFTRQHYPQPLLALYAVDTMLERRVFSRAAAIMGRNRESLGVLRRRGYRGRLVHIPWGVDTHAFHPAEDEAARPYTIGFVGRLIGDKGLEDLLEASRLMKREHRLLLVGDGPMRPELETRAARPDGGRLELAGVVAHERMPAIYRRMDVLVLPSRTGLYWKEQFGRALVEAMACRVAVAGSDSGAIPDVIGEAGRVFPEGSPTALAAALDELADTELRGRLADRGLARARERFSWEAWALRTHELLREVTCPGPA